MDIFGFLGDIFKPASDLIQNLTTTEKEKLDLYNKLEVIQNEIKAKILDYESQLLKAQSDVIQSEAKGESWLQGSWRPISMLTFLVLVVCDAFGFLKFRLAGEAWTLLQLGIGGYVIGRSAEKIVPGLVQILQKKIE